MAFHVTPARNVARIMREGLLPRIGPRSRRLGEALPAIYLFADAESLESALDNWLGDEFDEEARLALIRVEAPEGTRTGEGAGFETVLLDPVPPACLEVLTRDLGGLTGGELAEMTEAGSPSP